MAKLKAKQTFVDPDRGPLISVRFAVAIALVVIGIAWIVYYYTAVRVDPTVLPAPDPGSPKFMADLKDWNYAIGFVLIFAGLVVAAHKKTPLGRGRGVVVGMLGCFLIGLVWIVTYYFVGQDASVHIPVMDQLNQLNLLVGVGFMAVGFTYATKWE